MPAGFRHREQSWFASADGRECLNAPMWGMPRAWISDSPTLRVSVFPVKIACLECLLLKMCLIWVSHEWSKVYAAQSCALSRDLHSSRLQSWGSLGSFWWGPSVLVCSRHAGSTDCWRPALLCLRVLSQPLGSAWDAQSPLLISGLSCTQLEPAVSAGVLPGADGP